MFGFRIVFDMVKQNKNNNVIAQAFNVSVQTASINVYQIHIINLTI